MNQDTGPERGSVKTERWAVTGPMLPPADSGCGWKRQKWELLWSLF